MNITEPFVLRGDVLLIPCADLDDDMRARISFDEGDYTLSRRHGRAMVQVIDGETAALLALFRQPHTIVEAVVENCRSFSRDPEASLDELLPHLGTFLDNRVLVPADVEDEKEIRPRFESGAAFRDWKIVRCASLIEDSEVYQLRRGGDVAALKIARLTAPFLHAIFDNEIAVLRRLDGCAFAPRLLESGEDLESGMDGERPFIIMDWVAGVDVSVAAAQRRHDRAALIELCASVAAAYAQLHARGVLHGDVHMRNVLAGERVTLLDFGYARLIDAPASLARAGLNYFLEPELLTASRQGMSIPASPAGEQYAVAALLYFLIAGSHYVDFRYDRKEMRRQAEEDPPLPFARRGIPPWPEVERILFRALEKDPAKRYGSMAELAAEFAEARDSTVRESLATPVSAEANVFLEATLQSFARGGAMFADRYPTPPTASIYYGAAGAAMALLRIAEARSDAALLALAEVWRMRAVALIGSDDAFYSDAGLLPRTILGDITPYHTDSGVHAAGALIAAAMADTLAQRRSVAAFIDASSRPCAQLDVTLGRSGTLLAAAMLLTACEESAPALRTFGARTMSAIWNELDARPPIEATTDSLGMAHGWTGYLYAALRWCDASGDPFPPRLADRLHEFTSLQTVVGRGVCWRTAVHTPHSFLPSWCNGSAGQVFLFTLAHRLLGHDEWLRLAELSAWNNWDEPRSIANLCCGSAGRAYALLNLYKHTGAVEWLSRARHLANHAAAHAAATTQRTNTLWKGELGVAVLIADLASPENARMPFFE